ncbi:response regulator [soil metagenome]
MVNPASIVLVFALFALGAIGVLAWRGHLQSVRRGFEAQSWARARQAELSQSLFGELSVREICVRATRQIADATGAFASAFYLIEGDELALYAGRALEVNAPDRISRSDGVLGASLEKGAMLQVRDVPKGYDRVSSILVLPAFSDGAPRGVLELGFLGSPTARALDLLPLVGETIAASLQSAQHKVRLRALLHETERRANELQHQQEELSAGNDELKAQGEALRETHEKLSEVSAALARASKHKSKVVANMSHDLRTPLNSTLILAKMLAENKHGNLDPDEVKYAETIFAVGNDLLALINDILDLSKVEAGKLDVRVAPVSIKALVFGLGRMFEPVAKDRSLVFEVSAIDGTFDSDNQRIEQILKNLLANAFKHTESGRVFLRVEARAGELRFGVEDTGVGIAKHDQEIIFEAFRQADTATSLRFGGTGLGLSIARDLARLLGGTVAIESTEAVGSTFTLSLPLAPGTVALGQIPVVTRIHTPTSSRAAAPKVSDDRAKLDGSSPVLLAAFADAAFALAVRDIGHDLGFQCLVADTADEALALATKLVPSSIILEVELPDHSGLALLDRLKRNPATRHIQVHLVAALEHVQKTGRALGAVGVAIKPVPKDALVLALERMRVRFAGRRSLLVVETDPVRRATIIELLQNDDVDIVAVATVTEALALLGARAFDCVVTDIDVGDDSGFALLERLTDDVTLSFPPVIVYTDRSFTIEEGARLRRHSSSVILKGVRSPERLVDEVALFLHQAPAQLSDEQKRMLALSQRREGVLDGSTILLAAADVRTVFKLTSFLERKGAKVIGARTCTLLLDALAKFDTVDLFILGAAMPELDGITATARIRALGGRFATLPILVTTPQLHGEQHIQAIDAGANACIAEPIDVEVLLSLVRVWVS